MAIRETTGSGIMFGTEGPTMTGTWINPKNGHKFTVRECFFQDGQFVVQTTDGQMLDYNTVQHYIQCTDKNGKEIPANLPKQSSKSELPPEVQNILLDENNEAISNNFDDLILEDDKMIGLGNINTPKPRPDLNAPMINQFKPTLVQEAEKSADRLIIERSLQGKSEPIFAPMISWDDTPESTIKMMINVLQIEPSEIVDYYTSTMDMELIRAQYKKCLKNYINTLLGVELDVKPTEATPEEESKPSKPKKKTNKTKK